MVNRRVWRGFGVCVVGVVIGLDSGGLIAQSATPATPGPAKPAAPRLAAAIAAAKVPLPPAIELAFRRVYPLATIKNVAKEKENGVEQYEIESVDQGQARDLMYLPDGTVLTIEEGLTPATFPPAVAAAIKARYPKAMITKREKLTIAKGHVVQYEAALSGANVKEVVLTVDGSWVSPKAK